MYGIMNNFTVHSSIIADICKTQQAMNKTFDKGLKKLIAQ